MSIAEFKCTTVKRTAMVAASKAVNSLRFLIRPFQGLSAVEMNDSLEFVSDGCYEASTCFVRGDADLVSIDGDRLAELIDRVEELFNCTQPIDSDLGGFAVDEQFGRLRDGLAGITD